MNAYFPYSYIIANICNSVKQTLSRHAYRSDSEPCGDVHQTSSEAGYGLMTEIYY